MFYKLSHLSMGQIKSIISLSKAIRAGRSEGADFTSHDLYNYFDVTPEEIAFTEEIDSLSKAQKQELLVLIALGRSEIHSTNEVQHLLSVLETETERNLNMKLLSTAKTMRIYLERSIAHPVHHRCAQADVELMV